MEKDPEYIEFKIYKDSIKSLVDINRDLSEEIARLNRVIEIMTGPMSVSPETMRLLTRRKRTRTLEGIYSSVSRYKDEEVN